MWVFLFNIYPGFWGLNSFLDFRVYECRVVEYTILGGIRTSISGSTFWVWYMCLKFFHLDMPFDF